MSDLVERLRFHAEDGNIRPSTDKLLREAADALERAERERDEARWRSMDEPPAREMPVLLFFGNLQWHDARTMERVTDDPVRDNAERTEAAFYRDGEWLETGTGHSVMEEWIDEMSKPTHWRPLNPPHVLSRAQDATAPERSE